MAARHGTGQVAVELGIAFNQRFAMGGVKKHEVVPREGDDATKWSLRCTGGRAVRNYRGWSTGVACSDCRELRRKEAEGG